MARDTMSGLIDRVQRLIDDEAGDLFSDDVIEEHLDRHRDRVVYAELVAEPTYATGGTVSYLAFCHSLGWGDWEVADLVAQDYASVTADTADLKTGRWTFSSEPDYPLYITGWSYDIYGAAAELLDMLMVRLGANCDNCDYYRKMATQYRTQTRQRGGVVSVEMVRGDVAVY